MLFGFEVVDLLVFIGISLFICITVCTLAMEAAVLFVPAFVFLFPRIITGFPSVTPNEAIGLAITVEVFGYTSSVLGYWFRRQVDLRLAGRILAVTVPAAILARVLAFFLPEDGLMLLFGVVLLGLAGVLYRTYSREDGPRHTCLLCGDSIAAMRMGDAAEDSAGALANPANSGNPGDPGEPDAGPADPAGESAKKSYPDLGGGIRFTLVDRAIKAIAGVFAGTTGVAIGEISNTFLTIRKQVPIKIATGTAALILHVTILAALGANLVVLFGDFEAIDVEEIIIPWRIAFILAPVVVIGGQIGSMLNSKLSDTVLVRMMMTAYILVGLFVLINTLTG